MNDVIKNTLDQLDETVEELEIREGHMISRIEEFLKEELGCNDVQFDDYDETEKILCGIHDEGLVYISLMKEPTYRIVYDNQTGLIQIDRALRDMFDEKRKVRRAENLSETEKIQLIYELLADGADVQGMCPIEFSREYYGIKYD